jgi:hypothetical protein
VSIIEVASRQGLAASGGGLVAELFQGHRPRAAAPTADRLAH